MTVRAPAWASAMPWRAAVWRSQAKRVRMKDEDGQDSAGEGGVKGELIAEGKGQGEHPLAHGHPGEDAIDELGGQLAPAAGAAGGAEAAAFTAEGHDHLIAALLTSDMDAAMLEAATTQVGAELAGDESREPMAAVLVGGTGQEGVEMGLEGAVEDGVLRSMALIAGGRGEDGHEPAPGAAAMPGGRRVGEREKSRGVGPRPGLRSAAECPRGRACALVSGRSADEARSRERGGLSGGGRPAGTRRAGSGPAGVAVRVEHPPGQPRSSTQSSGW
jgi:hypothetical protein